MSEERQVMKLTEEELKGITQVRSKTEAIIKEFGEIALAEINLKERKEHADAYLIQLKHEEKELATTLQEKYGKGNINLDTGEFVPVD